jgi:hypothetical protein
MAILLTPPISRFGYKVAFFLVGICFEFQPFLVRIKPTKTFPCKLRSIEDASKCNQIEDTFTGAKAITI